MSEAVGPGVEVREVALHVAVVELRRPPSNFVDVALVDELASACEQLASDGCRAVVLASEGKHFCAGIDMGRGGFTDDTGRDLYDAALPLFELPIPVVAAVQGAAVGGGLGLALAADLRVATPEARFAANFALLGFHHGFGLSVTLPEAVGRQAATELLCTGHRIDGEEALRIGLVDRLVPAEDLRPTAIGLASEIAAAAPLAVRSIRATLQGDRLDRLRVAMVREKGQQEELMQTSDWREGIRASRDRRPPAFEGR